MHMHMNIAYILMYTSYTHLYISCIHKPAPGIERGREKERASERASKRTRERARAKESESERESEGETKTSKLIIVVPMTAGVVGYQNFLLTYLDNAISLVNSECRLNCSMIL